MDWHGIVAALIIAAIIAIPIFGDNPNE